MLTKTKLTILICNTQKILRCKGNLKSQDNRSQLAINMKDMARGRPEIRIGSRILMKRMINMKEFRVLKEQMILTRIAESAMKIKKFIQMKMETKSIDMSIRPTSRKPNCSQDRLIGKCNKTNRKLARVACNNSQMMEYKDKELEEALGFNHQTQIAPRKI